MSVAAQTQMTTCSITVGTFLDSQGGLDLLLAPSSEKQIKGFATRVKKILRIRVLAKKKRNRKNRVPEDQQDYHRHEQRDQRGSVSDGVNQSHCGEV